MVKLFNYIALMLFGAYFLYAGDFQYVSPKPFSEFNSTNSAIIIKHGDYINKESISENQILVTGKTGNRYSGKTKLSTDGKTLVFVSDTPFELADEISVKLLDGVKNINGETIGAVDFNFYIEKRKVEIDFDIVGDDIILNDKDESYAFPVPDVSYEPVFNPATLPDDFPKIEITAKNNPNPGAYFFTHKGSSKGDFLIVLDTAGKVVAYKRTPATVGRFTAQPNGRITYNQRVKSYFMAFADAVIYVMDANFNLIDSIVAKNGIATAPHTCQLLPNGHIILSAFEAYYVDISTKLPGGHQDALLAGSIVQELDADKNLVFQWRSWDYYDITETTQNLKIPVTLFSNVNSVDLDKDGNYVLSNRLFSELLKVDRATGNIIWRLGGSKSDFSFVGEHESNAPFYFSLQHDIRHLPNGNITLFDNGGQHKPQYSRAVEYQLDETNKTATMVWEYRHSPDVFGSANGSMIRLPNGNSGIAWGSLADTVQKLEYTEVKPDGSIAFEFTTPPFFNSLCVLNFPWPVDEPTADVKVEELLILNKYRFSSGGKETGVSLIFKEYDGSYYNKVIVKRFDYGPQNPVFDGTAPMVAPYRFYISKYSINDFVGEIRFDVSQYKWLIEPEKWKVMYRETPGSGKFLPLETNFDINTSELVAVTDKFGEFIFAKDYSSMPPAKPLLCLPENTESKDYHGKVGFVWSSKGYTTSSRVQVATESSFDEDKIVVDTLVNQSVYSHLFDNSTGIYYWRVKSINLSGESDWSDIWQFTTDNPNITLIYPNGGETLERGKGNLIRWKQNFVDSVKIELYKNGAFYRELAAKTITHTGTWLWNIPNDIEIDSSYTLSVTSMKYTDYNVKSSGMFKIGEPTTDVEPEDNEFTNGITQISPIPANDFVEINYHFSKPGNAKASIYDYAGRKLIQFETGLLPSGNHIIRINTSDLTAGLYIVNLIVDEQASQSKFVVAK